MSVAVGIAQPRAVPGTPALIARDHRGNDHAASSGNARQNTAWPRCELPVQELAFDLETNKQEEERHQRVIDPMKHAETSDVRVERSKVGFAQRRVRDRKRGYSGGHQHDPAGGLAVQELSKRGSLARPGRRA